MSMNAIATDRPEPQPEYLTTREVEELTKYKKSTLEALRAMRRGPPFTAKVPLFVTAPMMFEHGSRLSGMVGGGIANNWCQFLVHVRPSF